MVPASETSLKRSGQPQNMVRRKAVVSSGCAHGGQAALFDPFQNRIARHRKNLGRLAGREMAAGRRCARAGSFDWMQSSQNSEYTGL